MSFQWASGSESQSLSARRTSTGTLWDHDRDEAEEPASADQPMEGKSSLGEIEGFIWLIRLDIHKKDELVPY